MNTFSSLLRRRPHFRRLWIAQIISLLGDWLSFVAVSLLALKQGDGIVALALVLVAHTLPRALLAPVAGALADRLDRRRMMIGANVAQGLLTLGMAGAAAAGSVWLVQLLVFARAGVSAFLEPVESAVMRHVVNDDELLTANAVHSVTWSVMFSVGMALGGLLAALGPAPALLIDAITFGLAALTLRKLPAMAAAGRAAAPLAAIAAVPRDMVAAFRYAWARPALFDAVLSKTPPALAGGGAWVLLNLVADDAAFIGSGALTLGLLQCVRGVGTGVGPMLSAWMIRRRVSEQTAGQIAQWTAYGGIALFALSGHWAPLTFAALAWGAGVGSNWVLSSATIQRLSPDAFIGRLSALDWLIFTVGMCAAALGGAALVEHTGSRPASAWLGLALGVSAWAALQWVLRRRTGGADERAATAEPELPG